MAAPPANEALDRVAAPLPFYWCWRADSSASIDAMRVALRSAATDGNVPLHFLRRIVAYTTMEWSRRDWDFAPGGGESFHRHYVQHEPGGRERFQQHHVHHEMGRWMRHGPEVTNDEGGLVVVVHFLGTIRPGLGALFRAEYPVERMHQRRTLLVESQPTLVPLLTRLVRQPHLVVDHAQYFFVDVAQYDAHGALRSTPISYMPIFHTRISFLDDSTAEVGGWDAAAMGQVANDLDGMFGMSMYEPLHVLGFDSLERFEPMMARNPQDGDGEGAHLHDSDDEDNDDHLYDSDDDDDLPYLEDDDGVLYDSEDDEDLPDLEVQAAQRPPQDGEGAFDRTRTTAGERVMDLHEMFTLILHLNDAEL